MLGQQLYPLVSVQMLAQVPQWRHSPGSAVLIHPPSGSAELGGHSVYTTGEVGQVHFESTHHRPPAQARPQPPQLPTSLVKSRQIPPQSVSWVVPTMGHWQAPPVQM